MLFLVLLVVSFVARLSITSSTVVVVFVSSAQFLVIFTSDLPSFDVLMESMSIILFAVDDDDDGCIICTFSRVYFSCFLASSTQRFNRSSRVGQFNSRRRIIVIEMMKRCVFVSVSIIALTLLAEASVGSHLSDDVEQYNSTTVEFNFTKVDDQNDEYDFE